MRLSTRLGQLCPAKHADATGLRTQATNPQVNTPCGQDAPRRVNPLARKTRPREPRPHHEEGERTCLSTRLGQLCPAKHADATGLLSQVTNPQVNTPCGQDAHSKTGNGCREAPPAVSKQRGSVATKGPPETAQRRAQRSATKRDEGPRRRNTGMDTPFPQKKAQRDALRLYAEKKNSHHRPQDRTLSDTNVISMETLLRIFTDNYVLYHQLQPKAPICRKLPGTQVLPCKPF